MKIYRNFRTLITTCLLMAVVQVGYAADGLTYLDVEDTRIENLGQPAPNRFSSAQPTQEQLAALSAAGVKHIVSLRPESELEWDEREIVESLGMTFHRLPVAGADGINHDNAENFSQLLAEIGDEPALVHCASGNRVGAMVALKHGADTGDVDTAVTLGQAWGLTVLEDMVRDKLQEQQ